MLSGLRSRLLALTTGFVLFATLLIYPVLAGSFRNTWLMQRAQAAEIAALAVEAAPDGRVSDELSLQLLTQAQVVSVAVQEQDFREQILAPSIEIGQDLVTIDLRTEPGFGILGAFSHMFAPEGRFLRILVAPKMTQDAEMEVIVPEVALKEGLLAFSRSLLLVAIIISVVVGALVYLAIYRLVVQPVRLLTRGMVRFANTPEAADIEPVPGHTDEMKQANSALQSMQKTVSAAFRQRKRLAELGEAVAKINHDLRNSLAAAQIVSESLSHSEDPRVQRAAPRLERAIQRAVGLAEATLRYGRAEPSAPNLSVVNLAPTVEEAAAEGLAGCDEIEWQLDARGQVTAMADPEHVHRIVANLVRNAARAIKDQKDRTCPGKITARVSREADKAVIEISDNGPGVPPKIVSQLFQPFSGSASRGGAGLGLAIARELARGMKGDVELSSNGAAGAAFKLRVPAV
ncbi:MAG: HAMP domain-containing histidine kinase [Hyphomonadaceae bacterium]|nr:HAMP domain-containing histidine kinase [Hyphomonadaceae bacterium]